VLRIEDLFARHPLKGALERIGTVQTPRPVAFFCLLEMEAIPRMTDRLSPRLHGTPLLRRRCEKLRCGIVAVRSFLKPHPDVAAGKNGRPPASSLSLTICSGALHNICI
jgi:hypothetical protein